MLDKHKFIDFINTPQKLSLDDIMSLENVLKTHPYFQLGHVLMAKAVHIKAPEIANDALRKAAAYSLSRNALRKIIENEIDWVTSSTQKAASDAAIKKNENAIFDEELQRERLEDDLIEAISSPPAINIQDEQLAIIEKFIKTEPRISPIRRTNDEEQEIDLSEQSTTLIKPLATESYAKILCIQGRNEQAIEVYQKLIAKYPEKSAYFASKIEELNKIME